MRPRHDPLPRVPAGTPAFRRARKRNLAAWLTARIGRRGGDAQGEPGGEPVPVRPDRPLDLSGGAAAALAFDE